MIAVLNIGITIPAKTDIDTNTQNHENGLHIFDRQERSSQPLNSSDPFKLNLVWVRRP